MSRKQREQGAAATAPNREGRQSDGSAHSAGPHLSPPPDGFYANVFTWTGPGIENIFIDFEPARQRKRRASWNDGERDR